MMSGLNICILCGSSKTVLVTDETRDGRSNDRIVRCLGCNLVFISPLPSEEDLVSFYRNAYHRNYFESFDLKHYHSTYRLNSLRRAEYVLSQKIASKKLHLLDIGCGTGSFLEVFSQEGWQTYGIELNEDCARFAKQLGLRVHVGSLGSFKSQERQFDIVTMWHVLEHILDPLAMLRKINLLLKDDGIFIGEVPHVNDYRLVLLRNRDFSRFFYHRAHLFYFNKDTLKRMLNKAGFAVVDICNISIEGIDGIIRMFSGEHARLSKGEQKLRVENTTYNRKVNILLKQPYRLASALFNKLLCLINMADNLLFFAKRK